MTGLIWSVVVMLLLIAGCLVRRSPSTTSIPSTNDAELHPRWVDQHDYG